MIHMKLEHKLDQYFAIFEPNERVTIVGEKEEQKGTDKTQPFRVLLSAIRIPIKIINNMDRINDSNNVPPTTH